MNRKRMMFFCVGMMILLAGCSSFGKTRLPSGRNLSIDKKSGYKVELAEFSPGVFKDTKGGVTVTENGDSFQIQIPGRIGIWGPQNISISAPPKGIPIFVQPFTRVILDDAKMGDFDIKKMQFYISGTVVLEYEKLSTVLQDRDKNTPTRENLKGTNLTGQVTADEMITKSAYENTLHVLEAMTPGVALEFSQGTWQNILEVSFENSAGGERRFLRFVQDYNDSDGYFYLEPLSKTRISYGDKEYEIRFDERGGKPPYLMIRTELPPYVPNSHSLPGRRVP